MATSIQKLKRYNGSSWVDILPTKEFIYLEKTIQSSNSKVAFIGSNNETKYLYTLECSGFDWKPSMVIAFNDPSTSRNTIYTCTISIYSNLTYYNVLEGYKDVTKGFVRIDGTACIEKGKVIVPVSRSGQYIIQLYGDSNT